MSLNMDQIHSLLATFQAAIINRPPCGCGGECIPVSVHFNEAMTGVHIVWRCTKCGKKIPCTC